MESNATLRIERDGIGSLELGKDVVFGIQTQRAVDLYPLAGQKRFADRPELLNAMFALKKACAQTNVQIGALDPSFGAAIEQAAADLLSDPRPDFFPVHAAHGGGGISFNMNVNEVLANLANAALTGAAYGTYSPVTPADHVNLNHSTADSLSTACHIAARKAFVAFEREMADLLDDLETAMQAWGGQRKLARTCLQDAVDITFADYLGGVCASLSFSLDRARRDADSLRAVSLGATIIGRREDCDPAFFAAILPALNAELERMDLPANLRRADNLFAATQAQDHLLALGRSLDHAGRTLMRFAKDLRLMASGPVGGLSEIRLPAVQTGSSAIPGKVNPTIPEFMVQSAMIAAGHAHTMAMTQDHGELDYNPWQAVVIGSLLDMLSVLESGVATLRRHCVQGMVPDATRNDDLATSLLPSLIHLKQLKGYSYASRVAKDAKGNVDAVRREVADADRACSPSHENTQYAENHHD